MVQKSEFHTVQQLLSCCDTVTRLVLYEVEASWSSYHIADRVQLSTPGPPEPLNKNSTFFSLGFFLGDYQRGDHFRGRASEPTRAPPPRRPMTTVIILVWLHGYVSLSSHFDPAGPYQKPPSSLPHRTPSPSTFPPLPPPPASFHSSLLRCFLLPSTLGSTHRPCSSRY